jgi:DNA-binding ferritin-like protein
VSWSPTNTCITASQNEEVILPTGTTSENIKQSTRITVTSLKPSVNFSESCDPVSVTAQGCAMHSAKEIAVGTPVLLRLPTGTEAKGQIAFCKASLSSDKLWGLGVVLDEPRNFGAHPCPKDLVVGNEDDAVSLDNRGVGVGVAKTPESSCIPDLIRAEADTIRVELREQISKEIGAIFTDLHAKFEEEIHAQRKNAALAEALLQDAAAVRESLAAALQSLPETLDRKVSHGVENALQQIDVRMNTLMRKAQSESEQLQQQLRRVGDEMDRHVHQSVSANLEKVQHQVYEVANKYLEEKRQEIADATVSMRQVSDQICSALQRRLENEFDGKQEIIGSSQNAIATEVAHLQAQVGNVDDRIAKLDKLCIELESNFRGRLNQTVSETITQALTSLKHLLGGVVNEQLGLARAAAESMRTSVSTRADSSIQELREFVEMLNRERDETQAQIGTVRQEKEEMQLWLARQDQDFRKAIEDALFDARIQGNTSVQKALDLIQDPVEKLSCEAKKKIEEGAARQCAELGEGMRVLRDQLATLREQAGDSLRASLRSFSEPPNQP